MMTRLKFFAFRPRPVRCFACKAEGPSRLHKPHFAGMALMFTIALALTWLTGMIPSVPRPFTLGSYFGPAYTPWLVGFWWFVVASKIFSQRAHRCAACGSEFLKPI